MTKRVISGTIAAAVLVVGAVGWAQTKDKKPVSGKGEVGGQAGAPAMKEEPKPQEMKIPEVSEEMKAASKAMTGTWKCTGKVLAHMGHPERAMTATMKWKADHDGYWLTGVYEEKKSKDNPRPYKFTEHRSYDAGKQRWVALSVDNMGGVGIMMAAGGTGAMKWEGKSEIGGMTLFGRGTEELVSAREVKISGEMSQDGKTWTQAYEATCKK
jgi:hypothetical protein